MTTSDLPPLPTLEPASPLEPVTPVPAAPVAEPVAEVPTFTLDELAAEFGQLAKPAPDAGKYFWRHRVADTLHGWYYYQQHYGDKPIKLSKDDYKAALAAVDTMTPHEPAVRK